MEDNYYIYVNNVSLLKSKKKLRNSLANKIIGILKVPQLNGIFDKFLY